MLGMPDLSQIGERVTQFDQRLTAIEAQLNRMEALLKNVQPVGNFTIGTNLKGTNNG